MVTFEKVIKTIKLKFLLPFFKKGILYNVNK